MCAYCLAGHRHWRLLRRGQPLMLALMPSQAKPRLARLTPVLHIYLFLLCGVWAVSDPKDTAIDVAHPWWQLSHVWGPPRTMACLLCNTKCVACSRRFTLTIQTVTSTRQTKCSSRRCYSEASKWVQTGRLNAKLTPITHVHLLAASFRSLRRAGGGGTIVNIARALRCVLTRV